MARLEIEHIIPLAQGGTNDKSNLCGWPAPSVTVTRATRPHGQTRNQVLLFRCLILAHKRGRIISVGAKTA
jgi:hypothetical protein